MTSTSSPSSSSTSTTLLLLQREYAQQLDKEDALAPLRTEFHFPKKSVVLSQHKNEKQPAANAIEEEVEKNINQKNTTTSDDHFIYLCGHSLGLQHVGVEAALQSELAKWRDQGVEGHFLEPNPWFEIDNILRADMAALVGATASETVIMNTLTGNLHLLLARFYQPKGERTKILCEKFPFPSDMHALVSIVKNRGYGPEQVVEVSDPKGGAQDYVLSTEAILAAIEQHGSTTAVLWFSAVHFLSGQYFDIARITAAAHKHGVLVGIDAAHGAGNVPMKLHEWGVDFACWCTYKYINAGPGNIGALFVHEKHSKADGASRQTELHGWWGHKRTNRFALHRDFDANEGAGSMQLSNPSVVSMMSLAPSVRCMAKCGIEQLRSKSVRLTGYLEKLLQESGLMPRALVRITPEESQFRGAMLTFYIQPNTIKKSVASEVGDDGGYECGTNLNNDADLLQKILLQRGVMCDNRPPNIVRITAVPLYNSFEDVWRFVAELRDIFDV